jgi:hypothetical protein
LDPRVEDSLVSKEDSRVTTSLEGSKAISSREEISLEGSKVATSLGDLRVTDSRVISLVENKEIGSKVTKVTTSLEDSKETISLVDHRETGSKVTKATLEENKETDSKVTKVTLEDSKVATSLEDPKVATSLEDPKVTDSKVTNLEDSREATKVINLEDSKVATKVISSKETPTLGPCLMEAREVRSSIWQVCWASELQEKLQHPLVFNRIPMFQLFWVPDLLCLKLLLLPLFLKQLPLLLRQ